MTEDSAGSTCSPSAAKMGEEERPLTAEERRRQFGEKLRATRESLGRTEKDVIHLTRISPPFVRALEDGQFDELPGEVFGRGFIKNICKALDIDSAPLLAEYDACWDSKSLKAKGHMAHRRALKTRLRSERPYLPWRFVNYFSLKAVSLWIGLPVAITASVIAVLVQIPFFTRTSSPGVAADRLPVPSSGAKLADREAEPQVLQVVQGDEGASEQERLVQGEELPKPLAGEPAQAAESAKTRPAQTIEPLSLVNRKGDHSQLLVKVSEAVEIKYKIDQEKSQAQVYQPGSYQFLFKDKADFYVFDIAKVHMEFDGQQLAWYGPQVGEKRLSFVGKDVKQEKM